MKRLFQRSKLEDDDDVKPSLVARILGVIEHTVLVLIAVVLIGLSILLLVQGVQTLVLAIRDGSINEQAVPILEDILLVLMTMEIVYTVSLSIESHKLQAEPFLVIGTIAAIRRVLVITAESSQVLLDTAHKKDIALELGMLCAVIIVMAVSIFILRRSDCFKLQTQLALYKKTHKKGKNGGEPPVDSGKPCAD